MGELEKFRRIYADKTNEELEVIVNAAPKDSEEHGGACSVLLERCNSEVEQMTVEDALRLKAKLDASIFNTQLAMWIAFALAIVALIFVITWGLFF